MREARKRGAKIESMAESRPMCGRCQKGAKRMGILRRVITAFKNKDFYGTTRFIK